MGAPHPLPPAVSLAYLGLKAFVYLMLALASIDLVVVAYQVF